MTRVGRSVDLGQWNTDRWRTDRGGYTSNGEVETVRFGGWMDLKLKEDMQLPAAMEAMREFLL